MSPGFLDEAGVRVAVIEHVAIEKHRGSEEDFPE